MMGASSSSGASSRCSSSSGASSSRCGCSSSNVSSKSSYSGCSCWRSGYNSWESDYSSWESSYYREHNERVLEELDEGDIVQFSRKYLYHYAIYIGNDEVVHLTGEGEICIEDIKNVAGKSKIGRHNFYDEKETPFSPSSIVERAESQIGKANYNGVSRNCEHFATWCRYDVAVSYQSPFVIWKKGWEFIKALKDIVCC